MPDKPPLLLAALAFCALASPAPLIAQDPSPSPTPAERPGQEAWEGKPAGRVVAAGFRRQRWAELRNLLTLREGAPYDRAARDQDLKTLFARKAFRDVRIEPKLQDDGTWLYTVTVQEYDTILDVQFTGLAAVPVAALKPLLQVNPGDALNPYLLKLDREAIREHLLSKGYHFSAVNDEVLETSAGLVLVWHVAEGPLVRVKSVEFSGVSGIDLGTLKQYLLTKEPSSFLFFPGSGEPFIRRYLDEDLKRIKLYYQLEGFLDITEGDRVFVEDLVFTEDRTGVNVRIHVDEGRRFKVRSISFEGVSGKVVPEDQLRAALWLGDKNHPYFSDNVGNRDVQKIRDLYGERAYILAQVEYDTVIPSGTAEIDVKFRITEGHEVKLGRITVQGNTKTRQDVILRELRDFVPGEKFNNQLLQRGVSRLRDRQFFEQGGVTWRTEPTDDPSIRDLVLEVKEGQTGNLRFAGGYSSSFGILGVLEFSQKNFDIADLPKSFSDVAEGTAFAGGGQQFNIRFSPSRLRTSFTVAFREPWLFGTETGGGVRAFNIRTERESWDEQRIGGTISFDKRFEPFQTSLAVQVLHITIRNTDETTPSTVLGLAGRNQLVTLAPGIAWDTRDSALFPTRGHRISLTYEWAGDPLPSDFDYAKTTFSASTYFTVYESETKMKHVMNLDLVVGHARERGDSTVPFFERFYAGGRESIRGFDFRGVGPKENGDPIGGNGSVFASAEYSYPLFVEFLRGALFYDLANLTPEFDDLKHEKWRNTVGFGIRFIIPQLGNIPVKLDFGFPLTKRDDDERETVLFDIGTLF